MRKYWLAILVAAFISNASAIAPWYNIVGSYTIRPNSVYRIAVSTHGIAATVDMKVGIKGTLNDGTAYSNLKTVSIPQLTTKIVTLTIGDIKGGTYKLYGEGTAGMIFTGSSPLNVNWREFQVHIQTDRPIYKANDEIKYRISVMNADFRPLPVDKTMNLYIDNPQGNVIHTVKNINLVTGMHMGFYTLSSAATLGTWNLRFVLGSDIYREPFEVGKYVPDPFNVKLKTIVSGSGASGKIVAYVSAINLIGGFIKGKVTLSFNVNGIVIPVDDIIDGKKTIEVPFSTLSLPISSINTITAIATVTDDKTKAVVASAIQTQWIDHSQYIEIFRGKNAFKPGILYSAWYAIKNNDPNDPPITITNANNVAELCYTLYALVLGVKKPTVACKNVTVTQSLTINVEFPTYASTVLADYKLTYGTASETVTGLFVSTTNSPGEFVQARIMNENEILSLSDTEPIIVEVRSTIALNYITYHMMRYGEISTANTINLNGEKLTTFKITPTWAMQGFNNLKVYFVSTTNTFIYDNIEIEMARRFQTPCEIHVSKSQAYVGETVTFTLNSTANSRQCGLGYDSNVLFYKKSTEDFDWNREEIMEKSNRLIELKSSYPAYWSIGNALMTNVNQLYRRRRRDIIESEVESLPSVIRTKRQTQYTTINLDYAPTFVWRDVFDSGSTGIFTWDRTVPRYITTWYFTACATNLPVGWGMSDVAKLEVLMPVSINIDGPSTVNMGENVEINHIISNDQAVPIDGFIVINNPNNTFAVVDMTDPINPIPNNDAIIKIPFHVNPNSSISFPVVVTPNTVGDISYQVDVVPSVPDAFPSDTDVITFSGTVAGTVKPSSDSVSIDVNNGVDSVMDIPVHRPDSCSLAHIIIDFDPIEIYSGNHEADPWDHNASPAEMALMTANSVANQINNDILQSNYDPQNSTNDINTLQQAYSNLITNMKPDGLFGIDPMNIQGSTGFTADVLSALNRIKKHIPIDDTLLDVVVAGLKSKQNLDGSFKEQGKSYFSGQTVTSSSDVALTSEVLSSLLSCDTAQQTLNSNVINSTSTFIGNKYPLITDPYAIGKAAIALKEKGDAKAQDCFNKFKGFSKTDSNGNRYWNYPATSADHVKYSDEQLHAVDVEMTADALKLHAMWGLAEDCKPIYKYLKGEQNDIGGFKATKDTNVGIEAMYLYNRIKTFTNNGEIKVEFNNDPTKTVTIKTSDLNSVNILIPNGCTSVKLTTNGNVVATSKIKYEKFDFGDNNASNSLYNVTVNVQSNLVSSTVIVCASYEADIFGGDLIRDKTVCDVDIPTGLELDPSFIQSWSGNNLNTFEFSKRKNNVKVNFLNLNKVQQCVSIPVNNRFNVGNQQSTRVRCYNFYNSFERSNKFYNIKQGKW